MSNDHPRQSDLNDDRCGARNAHRSCKTMKHRGQVLPFAFLLVWQNARPDPHDFSLAALKDMQQQEANRQEAMHSSGQTAVSAHIQSHLDWLATEIAKLETEIDDHIDGHPELKTDAELMRSIPGIGPRTVAKLLAYAGNVRQFQNAKALAAYAGVTPRQHQSGSSVVGRTMLSRAGNAKLRHALYMPGLVARRHNPTLKGFGDRLKANGLAPKAVIGAVMRKLLHIIYGVITSGKPFQANFASPRLDLQDGI